MKKVNNDLFKGFEGEALSNTTLSSIGGGATRASEDHGYSSMPSGDAPDCTNPETTPGIADATPTGMEFDSSGD